MQPSEQQESQEDMIQLTRAELHDFRFILRKMVKHLKDNFGADGYNLGVNCGEAAGQTYPCASSSHPSSSG